MNKIKATIVLSVLMALGSANFFMSSCSEKSKEGKIIFTRYSGKTKLLNSDSTGNFRYQSQTEIAEIDPENSEQSLKVLTREFYSARSPKVSYDGRFLLFTAQQKADGTWQIWEMNLKNLKSRKISTSVENCTDPAYLPGGKLVFSQFSSNDSLKSGLSLFTCNLDGTNLKRITYNPASYFESNIIRDGRILTISRQVFPDKGNPMLMIMRPDGTKADLFYQSSKDYYPVGPAMETVDGKILFTEFNKATGKKDNLISISYNRPLHSRVNLSELTGGDFQSILPLRSGKLLVSYRKTQSDRFSIYEFDREKKLIGKVIYANTEFDILEAIESGQYERPKKLPSEVDMGVKTGLLMCQDINISDMPVIGIKSSSPKASRIEIIGIDSTLGKVDVEADGSFYLKVMADKPFRIKTLDKNGKVLSGPGSWIWLRPNERRGCVGCHQDPEMVPENKVPLAVRKLPVIVPVHLIKVVEKKVSLE